MNAPNLISTGSADAVTLNYAPLLHPTWDRKTACTIAIAGILGWSSFVSASLHWADLTRGNIPFIRGDEVVSLTLLPLTGLFVGAAAIFSILHRQIHWTLYWSCASMITIIWFETILEVGFSSTHTTFSRFVPAAVAEAAAFSYPAAAVASLATSRQNPDQIKRGRTLWYLSVISVLLATQAWNLNWLLAPSPEVSSLISFRWYFHYGQYGSRFFREICYSFEHSATLALPFMIILSRLRRATWPLSLCALLLLPGSLATPIYDGTLIAIGWITRAGWSLETFMELASVLSRDLQALGFPVCLLLTLARPELKKWLQSSGQPSATANPTSRTPSRPNYQ